MNTRSLLRSLAPVALFSALAALAHCGGQVAELPACPTDTAASCVANDACRKPTGDTCNGAAVSVTCHCGPSGFACDAPPACPPPPKPPSCGDTIPTGSCSVEGWTCALPNTPSMCGDPVDGTCVCQSGQWECAMPVSDDCEPAPPPPTAGCPNPAQLFPETDCTEQGVGASCPADIRSGDTIQHTQCVCAPNGPGLASWQCGYDSVDAGSVPPSPGH